MSDHSPRRKAYSYLRFSSPEQGRGDSYRRQTELSRKYAEEHGLDLDESTTFQDLGISAFSGDHIERGALGKFLEAVKVGSIPPGSVLLVESLDRLSRDKILTALNYFTALLGHGLEIVTLGDGIVYTKQTVNENPGKLLISITIMQRAHEESVTKSKRISAAWEARRRRAREQGGEFMARCPAWLEYDKANRRFIPIPERAEVVRRIYELADGGCGAVTIAKKLNKERVPPFGKSVRGWHNSYVKKILSSETVVGTYQPHRIDHETRTRTAEGPPIPKFYPTVVPESLFLAVKDRKKIAHLAKGKQSESFNNLLSGLCKCRQCGSSMLFINKGGGETYLVCSRSQNSTAEHGYMALQYTTVQSLVVQSLVDLEFPERRYGTTEGKLLVLEDELAEERMKLERAQQHLRNLFDAFEETFSPELVETTRSIQAKVSTIRATIERVEAEIESTRADRKALQAATRAIPEAITTLFSVEEHEDKELRTSTRRQFNLLLRKMGLVIELDNIKSPEVEYFLRIGFRDDPASTLNIRGFRKERKARVYWEVGAIPMERVETEEPDEGRGYPAKDSDDLGDFGLDNALEAQGGMEIMRRMIYGVDWPPSGVIVLLDEFCPEDLEDRIWDDLPKIAEAGATDVPLRHARLIFHRRESEEA